MKYLVQEFLDSYPSGLNNKNKSKIKKYFIELVKVLEYKTFSNGNRYDTQELTTSEGFLIYEKISIYVSCG
jgi:hypothetical protein